MNKLLKITSAVLVSAVALFGAKRPFPQQMSYPGCIKPNDVSQNDMNRSITNLYDHYKSSFVRRSPGGKWHVFAQGNGTDGELAETISEAHGYGMMIMALMAGYEPQAKEIFDSMNQLRKEQKSEINKYLMSWIVYDPDNGGSYVKTAATDGDFDNAYALLLAYDQWGDQKYLDDAKELINRGIKTSEMGSSTYRTLLGDWSQNDYDTRSSDWMPGHMRAFATATNDQFWTRAASEVYTLIDEVSNPTTGLVPDFASGDPAYPDASAGGTGEMNADRYSYNACRFPWRIALDYAHNGTADAKNELTKLYSWLRKSTGGEAANVKGGYHLNGSVLGNYSDLVFTAPFTAGAIVDPENQDFLNDMWNYIESNRGNNKPYTVALNLLSMLLVSGNWWAPGSSTTGNPTYALSVYDGLGSGSYEKGENVRIVAANAPDGYGFDKWTGDVSGLNLTDSVETFSMPAKNIVIQANYKLVDLSKAGPNLINIAGWEAMQGKSKSTVTLDTAKQTSDTLITGSISLQGDDKDYDCWGKISGYTNGKYDNLSRVSVTYKSDKPLRITLDEEALAMKGVPYGYTLPATGGSFSTVIINMDQFEQPDWAKDQNLDAPMSKKDIASISLAFEEKPGSVNFAVKEIRVDGFVQEIINKDEFKLVVNGGTGDGTYKKDADVSVKADEPAAGHIFVGWSGDTASLGLGTALSGSFKMPAKDITITAQFKDTTSGGVVTSNNLVLIAGWESMQGKSKSTVTIDTSKQVSDTLISAAITLDGDDKDYDCWGKITAYAAGKYDNLKQVTVTYKSDKPLRITLDENELAIKGVPYGFDLPATDGAFKTVTATTDQFKQPTWAKDVNLDAPLTKAKIQSISIAFEGKPGAAKFSVKEVNVDGFVQDVVKDEFKLVVNGGTGDGSYKKGTKVSVKADTPAKGFEFIGWSGDTASLGLGTAASAAIIMPGKNITITALFKDTTSGGGTTDNDLVLIAGWEGTHGKFGSTVDVDTLTDSEVSTTINLAKDPADDYSWAKTSAYAAGSFKNLTEVTITYKSDKEFNLVLDEEALGKDGVSYFYKLPAASSLTTVTISTDRFAQPEWAADAKLDAPLTKANIGSISLEATAKGAATNITVTSLIAKGFIPTPVANTVTAVESFNKMAIGVSDAKIKLNGLKESSVMVTLVDLQGRRLFHERVALSGGTAAVALPATMSRNKVVILAVQGESLRSVQKVMLR